MNIKVSTDAASEFDLEGGGRVGGKGWKGSDSVACDTGSGRTLDRASPWTSWVEDGIMVWWQRRL